MRILSAYLSVYALSPCMETYTVANCHVGPGNLTKIISKSLTLSHLTSPLICYLSIAILTVVK